MAVPVHSIKPQVAVHFTDVEIGWPITPQQLLSNPNQVSHSKWRVTRLKVLDYSKDPYFPEDLEDLEFLRSRPNTIIRVARVC